MIRVMVHNLIKDSIGPMQATNQPHCLSTNSKTTQQKTLEGYDKPKHNNKDSIISPAWTWTQ